MLVDAAILPIENLPDEQPIEPCELHTCIDDAHGMFMQVYSTQHAASMRETKCVMLKKLLEILSNRQHAASNMRETKCVMVMLKMLEIFKYTACGIYEGD